MRRTLLLCFVHGFQGGADTFGANSRFAQDLRQRVAAALPRVDVRVAVYPPYATRGELTASVARFVEWLLEHVIDLEVAARTPSPTVDPSVRCVLIGHSMGGIVCADALLSLVGDKRVGEKEGDEGGEPHDAAEKKKKKEEEEGGRGNGDDKEVARPPELNGLMFPYVQAVLGFDTPYLGIAPGVVAHGAEGQYTAASAALAQITELTDALWGGGNKDKKAGDAKKVAGALPAPESSSAKSGGGSGAAAAAAASAASSSPWGWGKIAMYAGAGALASAGAAAAATAAYRNRAQLSQGWLWAASHLEFVGCLARGEELRRRIAGVLEARRQLGVGFGNLYTRLGKAASGRQPTPVGALLPQQRTFCNLPARQDAGDWRPAVNDAATDETWAHMNMFDPGQNPNYDALLADARGMIVQWTQDTEWYKNSGGSSLARVT